MSIFCHVARLVAPLCLALLAACDDGAPPSEPVTGKVTHIVDGDTFLIGKTRIRICGIDAPPQGHPGYRQSAMFLKNRIEGKVVHCIPVGAGAACDGRDMPQGAGRVVAQCFFDNADLADELVRAGHARDWRGKSGR